MKKLVCLTITILLILVMSLSVTACDSGDGEVIEKGQLVEGLSAYTLASQAYYDWKDATNYQRTEELDFKAAGGLATQKAKQIYKKDGDNVYSEKVTYGSGLGKANLAEKLLKVDSNYYSILLDGKDYVPGEGNDGVFTVVATDSEWGKFGAPMTDAEAGEDKIYSNRKMLTSYDLSKKEYLADDSDDSVYMKDDLYYCYLTLKVGKDYLYANQLVAMEEFEGATGANKNTIDMETITITFGLEKVGETYRVKNWSSFEKYKGKRGIAITPCDQTYKATFSYDEKDYKIDAASLVA